jgi:hypothetical protein
MTLKELQSALKDVIVLQEASKLSRLLYEQHVMCQQSANRLTGYFNSEIAKKQKSKKVVELPNASSGKNI